MELKPLDDLALALAGASPGRKSWPARPNEGNSPATSMAYHTLEAKHYNLTILSFRPANVRPSLAALHVHLRIAEMICKLRRIFSLIQCFNEHGELPLRA